MTEKISKLWSDAARAPQHSLDVQSRLAPLYAHTGSLLAAHAAGLLLCAVAIIRIGGSWPNVLLFVSLVLVLLRVEILRRVRHHPGQPKPDELLRWRLPYQAVGVGWSIVNAAICCVCIGSGDDITVLLAVILISGVTAGIVSRSSGTPQFASAQIAIWLLPFVTLALRMGSAFWTVIGLTLIYFAALRSIIGRHHADLLALIDSEQSSRRAHLALEEREAELRAIFETAAAGLTEMDALTNRFVRVNRVFCTMVGRDEQELLDGFNPVSMTHPDDLEEQARNWAAINETGKPYHCDRRFVRPDGSLVWARLGVSVAAWETNGRPKRLVTILHDITEAKLAEAALRSSQDWLRLSLDIGRVGTFRRDYVGGLIYCSRETRLIAGLPLGEAPVQAAVWFETVLPEDRAKLIEDTAACRAERRPILTLDYRFLHHQTGIRYAETRSHVEYDAAGQAIFSVGVMIDVTDRRRAESHMVHLAHHDALTDLPNRTLFRIHLDQALDRAQGGELSAVLYLDLDQFKEVNDTLGHPIGDALLRAVTGRLQGCCRPTDTVARLGGDEFAIIQSPVRQATEVNRLAERVIATLANPFEIEGQRVVVGTSVGIALVPEHGVDADRLLRNADLALYEAKASGRGCYRFFENALEERIQVRRALDSDLRRALEEQALDLFYQPQVSVATRNIGGFEALIRWHDPKRGFVLPDKFIPLAEANGLIVPIGAFVLNRACTQAAAWSGRQSVAVNLSASEFSSPALVETIAAALDRSGLDPTRLELEITESTMLQDTTATLDTLHRLKGLGVSIAIDDFGTGFSSLSYLQRFPFDKVKIDRSFIAPLGRTSESLAIVGAIINLCKGLDMTVTAEGVETERQLDLLAELGCTDVQGYYFSRPRAASDVAGLIQQFEASSRPRRAAAA